MHNFRQLLVLAVLTAAGPIRAIAADAATSAPGPLEVIGDVAVVSLPVGGFEQLSLDDKLLAWHLYQAAVAGRDIQFEQTYAHNLAIRKLCEEILLHSRGVDAATLKLIATYLKQQYIHTGIHGARTYTKMLPPDGLSFEALADAAKQAAAQGARFRLALGQSLEQHLAELRRPMFDAEFDRFSTTRTPPPGEDLLTASAVTFYAPDIRQADLQRFDERYPLNSTVVREGGKLQELVWRIGEPSRGIPPGPYADYLQRVVAHLEEARRYASPPNAEALRRLIEFYRTGDNADFSRYNIAWLKYARPTVDTINGFIENYRDPLEKRGAWEGIVFFVNEASSGWLRQVADKADYFESRTPYREQYKRRGVKPVANMVEILVETGDGGPISWSGINLPNETAVRQQYGSKNVLLWNGRRAREGIIGDRLINEFVWPEDRALLSRHDDAVIEVLVGFHEALGHASGKASDRLKSDPRDYLPGYYSWLEEERADLLALHHAWDPETMRIRRKDWSEEAATAFYKLYVAMQLWSLAEIPEGAEAIEETHQIGEHFAINYFLRKAGVIEVRKRTEAGREKTFYVVPDDKIPQMRQAVAELLAELQRIKAEGDLEAIRRLAEEYSAVNYDKRLAAEVRERKRALGIPSYFAYVFPELRLVTTDGRPTDVTLAPARSLLRQQMQWSGYTTQQLDSLPAGL
jgi:dipeptidyl-peptidase-3